MAKLVIKKDGTKEPFDVKKIEKSIAAAAQDANLPEKRKNEVVKQVLSAVMQLAKKKAEIATTEIREKILSDLNTLEPSVSKAWRKHEQTKGKV